jgi:hypothetical protein
MSVLSAQQEIPPESASRICGALRIGMSHPIGEPPLDGSLTHYMEERALAIALEKSTDAGQRARVEHLIALRRTLMQRRDAFLVEATAKRHARGEIYSSARVAAINAMGPGRASLEQLVRSLYLKESDARGVLIAHARSQFAQGLVSQRLLLASHTPDIADAARQMHAREEEFAAAWVAAIGDAGFTSELRQQQREALLLFRTAARAMYFVTSPQSGLFDDADAADLGKAWKKLDELAGRINIAPLSDFIALPDEGDSAAVPPSLLLPTVTALIAAIQDPAGKFPSRRAALAVLGKIRDALLGLDANEGRACFEVDI